MTPTRTPSPGSRLLKEGDRVTVASTAGAPPKTGILKYLGHTDFATGEWAGIELDEPLGKNDGTVAGKRYFRCAPNYGLFSPVHKVTRVTGSLDRPRRTHYTELERENISKLSPTPNSQDEHRRYAEDSEKRAQRLRQLLETAEAARRELATKLEEERKKVEELEFRIEEECIDKDASEMERQKEQQKIEELERKLEQEVRKNEMIAGGATPDSILKEETKRLNEEMESLREKLRQSEDKIKELQKIKQQPVISPTHRADELTRKEEALLQLELTLDNKKREVQNLLHRISELEKELEKSKARQSRQLDAIDELNVKLQKSESKRTSLEEELHATKEKVEELERRLRSSSERIGHLESEKQRIEEQLKSPEQTPETQAILARMQDRERELAEWRREAEAARAEADRLREDRERTRRDLEDKIQTLKEEHLEQSRQDKKKAEDFSDVSQTKIRSLEAELSDLRGELESARAEADARLSRQEARLQEAELKTDNIERLREQMSRLQSERDLLSVEKDEASKRLQISEDARARFEREAAKASDEVNLLKAQVHHLRTEFTNHREDLVKKLAETEFDAQLVQDLHTQIEEQRRVVETMQQKLKWTEVERDQLQTVLSTRESDQVQVENGLRQEVDTLRRRLNEAELERQAAKRSLEAAQLLIEERAASQHQQMIQNQEKIISERNQLQIKVEELERELTELKYGSSEPDSELVRVKQEKEALEQQVTFMNSVIVDMQHKNDDLRSRLDILETEVLFDNHFQLGMPQRVAPRLFCDICDLFDIHDTEDCPKQQNSVRRTPSYSSQESEF